MVDSANYNKKRFDSNKAKIQSCKVGDYVLKFKGPFKVFEVLDGDSYLLKSLTLNGTYKYPMTE